MTALAKIHIGKKQLGLDDDTYRALLARVTGKTSSAAMSERERLAVVAEMTRQGFKATLKNSGKSGTRRSGKVLSGPYAAKAQALWIALWNLGAVEDRRDSALLAFFARQTGIERSEWVLDARDGKAVVEALKSWCSREGVAWNVGPTTAEHLKRFGCQIAQAQWARLRGNGQGGAPFWAAVSLILNRGVLTEKPTDAEWITVMNEFGKRIRAGAGKLSKVA